MSDIKNCPKLPPPISIDDMIKNQTNGLAALMNSMGITSCKHITAGGIEIIPPGAIGGEGSVGCEQLFAQAQAVDSCQTQVTCIINKSVSSATTLDINQNELKLTISGSTIKCKNFNITQKITNDAKILTNITQQTTDEIVASIKNMVNSMTENAEKQKTGFMASNDGQKSINNFVDACTSGSISDNINNYVNKALTKVFNENNQNIKIDNSLIGCTDGDFTIDQTILNRIQAATIVNSVINDIFNTTEGNEYIQQFKQALEQEGEGAAGIIGMLAIVGIIILLGVPVFLGKEISNVMKYILPIAMLGFIIAAIILGIKKETLPMILCIVGTVIFGGLEFVSIKNSNTKTKSKN
jgi:hypothetical protein